MKRELTTAQLAKKHRQQRLSHSHASTQPAESQITVYNPNNNTKAARIQRQNNATILTCELLLEMDTNTSVSELRDLLIATVSFSLSPVAFDRLSLSLPARSTRWRVPLRDDR